VTSINDICSTIITAFIFMNLSKLRRLPLKTQMPVIAGVVLVFGLFAIVMGVQQQQDIRSRASGNCTTTYGSNPAYGNIYENDCTINGDFQGNLLGSRVTITGSMTGNIDNPQSQGNLIMKNFTGNIVGSGNEVCGNMLGNLTGNNNIIHGTFFGNNTGTGNIINSTAACGVVRITPTQPPPTQVPTIPPTATPTTIPNGTCADGIDNNQNELIDSGDPICHTDGNRDNPNSYDPKRNEVYPSVSPTRPPTIIPSPTLPVATSTPVPTVTVAPGNTAVSLNLLLHGIGKGGDSANPNSGGNPSPRRTQRNVTVEVYNSQNQLILTKQGNVSFGAANGNFTGQVDLGTTIATGVYSVKVKTTQFLNTLVPGIQSLTQGTVNQLPATVLVNGDIDGNNTLNILDYNILMGCYSDFLPAPSCSTTNKPLADLDDDGDVNQYDYNLFLREITNRAGQ
jgi:hypothetical protein